VRVKRHKAINEMNELLARSVTMLNTQCLDLTTTTGESQPFKHTELSITS
jgi:hypothetical protein